MNNFSFNKKNYQVGIIGLGYIGATLALEFSKKINTIGFDTSKTRVDDLKKKIDKNLEINKKKFNNINTNKIYTNSDVKLKQCNIFIITVPTPVTKNNKPDLRFIKNALNTVSKYLKKKDIIVIESTVYPGLTEELCKNYIEKKTRLKFNFDFFCGYSPERVNPGDKINNLKKLTKIVSGSNQLTTFILSKLYKLICNKIHITENIIIAESAKIIENCQRDINIAFMNELQIFFDKINVDINQVLQAASTKWNFLNFHPGLVGGHCIGVDPYYLINEFKKKNINSKIIKNSRDVNDKMTEYILKRILFFFKENKIIASKNKIIIFGGTFKENCPDQRNSKTLDLALILTNYASSVTVFDPYIDKIHLNKFKKIKIINRLLEKNINNYDSAIFAVPHQEFIKKNFYNKILFPKFSIRKFY